jgi:hypothetical protein
LHLTFDQFVPFDFLKFLLAQDLNALNLLSWFLLALSGCPDGGNSLSVKGLTVESHFAIV